MKYHKKFHIEHILMKAISRAIKSSSDDAGGEWKNFIATINLLGRKISGGIEMTGIEIQVEEAQKSKQESIQDWKSYEN